MDVEAMVYGTRETSFQSKTSLPQPTSRVGPIASSSNTTQETQDTQPPPSNRTLQTLAKTLVP